MSIKSSEELQKHKALKDAAKSIPTSTGNSNASNMGGQAEPPADLRVKPRSWTEAFDARRYESDIHYCQDQLPNENYALQEQVDETLKDMAEAPLGASRNNAASSYLINELLRNKYTIFDLTLVNCTAECHIQETGELVTLPYKTENKKQHLVVHVIPAATYSWVKWSDGNTENPRVFPLTRSVNLTPIVSDLSQYTISGLVTGGKTAAAKVEIYEAGMLRPNPYTCLVGSALTLKPISDPAPGGTHFKKWSDETTTKDRVIVVTGDATYTAQLVDNFTVACDKIGLGSVVATVGGSQVTLPYEALDETTNISLAAVNEPTGKGIFSKWIDRVSGATVSETTPLNISPIVQNYDLTCVFRSKWLSLTANSASEIFLSNPVATSLRNDVYCSKDDGATWSLLSTDSVNPTRLQPGEKLFLKCNTGGASFSTSDTDYNKINIVGSVVASGNIMSLIDEVGEASTIPGAYCFAHLFEGSAITGATELFSATTLAEGCYKDIFKGCNFLTNCNVTFVGVNTIPAHAYEGMFQGCTALASEFSLPATTLGASAYKNMFNGCTSLTALPYLAAQTVGESTYESMFEGCTSINGTPLVSATSMSVATCKNLFKGCTALTSSCALPVTALAQSCYEGMFEGTSITEAPELPSGAPQASCYKNMFKGTKITTAPALAATTLQNSCYQGMFQDCTLLTAMPTLPATMMVESCYEDMFNGCTTLAGAPTLPAADLAKNCYKQMFTGTAITQAPALPKTTLAIGCYQGMFKNCTAMGLGTNYTLPAEVLVENCYQDMFNGCTSTTFNEIHVLVKDKSAGGCVTNWMQGVNQLTTSQFHGVSAANWEQGDSGIQVNWEVHYVDCLTFYGTPNTAKLKITAGSNLQLTTTGAGFNTWDKSEITSATGRFYVRGTSGATPVAGFATNCTKVEGYATSLVDYINYNTVAINDNQFFGDTFGLFEACTTLTDLTHFVLPSTTLSKNCYKEMFNGCTGLINSSFSTDFLPATTLSEGCYEAMFNGCTGITSTVALPATTLAKGCYKDMFNGCTALNTIADRGAVTALSESCYEGMFQGCTSLVVPTFTYTATPAASCYKNMYKGCTGITTAPALPAVNMAESCYESMFEGCTSLTLPTEYELPAGKVTSGTASGFLAKACYKNMFLDCDAITAIPENMLPALTLEESCYEGMFKNADLFEVAPKLPAKHLATACYKSMFQGCSAINEVHISAIDQDSVTDALADWLEWTDTPTHIGDLWVTNENYTLDSGSGCPKYWTLHCPPMITLLYPAGTNTFSFGNGANIEYSIDLDTWTTVIPLTPVTFTSEKLYVRGKSGATAVTKFTGNFTVAKGDIRGLINYEDYETVALAPSQFNLGSNNGLFSGATSLVDASGIKLHYTSLTTTCFASMFQGCTALTKGPELIAKTLGEGCYKEMYKGCYSLTTLPTLAAGVTEGALAKSCYESMFENCYDATAAKGITTTPILAATELTEACYKNMFAGCKLLTAATTLASATTVAKDSCQYMFKDCVALTATPDFPAATTLAEYCYEGMFQDCTALTSIHALPATTLADYCYANMFNGCSTLPGIVSLSGVTTLAEACYYQMFANCAALTDLSTITYASANAKSCYNSMFKGCTGLTKSPILSATTLADSCYKDMYYGCTALATVPALPNATVGTDCYDGMFNGCTVLNKISCMLPDPDIEKHTNWLLNVSATGDFYAVIGEKAAGSTDPGWTRGGSGVPVGWNLHIIFALNFANSNGQFSLTSCANMEYSPDLITWTTFAPTETVTVAGNVVYLQGKSNTTPIAGFTGNFTSAQGSLNNLIDYSVAAPTLNANQFYSTTGLFENVLSLTDASAIIFPVGSTESCYRNMFKGCTALTKAPKFSTATASLALAKTSLQDMFNGCSALETAPALPFTSISESSCNGMFKRSAIKVAPELNVATLAIDCYKDMFNGCTALTTTAVDNATTLAESCYEQMYMGSGITSTGTFDVTTLAEACYKGMFKNCTSLAAVPALPATTLADYCYQSMFEGCTALTALTPLTLGATTLTQGCYNNMFKSCSGLTDLSVFNLPAGAPDAGGTTVGALAASCYEGMFQSCTGLTKSPALKANTLVSNCYKNLFNGCSVLEEIICHATNLTTSPTDFTNGWVTGVKVPTADVPCKFYGRHIVDPEDTALTTKWSRSVNGVPVDWIYYFELTNYVTLTY